MQHLFVYGTLAPGRENAAQLRNIPGTWHTAQLTGRLYPKGWGAARGYPGIVPDGRAEPVAGWVFSSHELSEHWPRLDAFEGEGYERRQVCIHVNQPSGYRIAAFVYALKQASTDHVDSTSHIRRAPIDAG